MAGDGRLARTCGLPIRGSRRGRPSPLVVRGREKQARQSGQRAGLTGLLARLGRAVSLPLVAAMTRVIGLACV